MLTFDLDVNRGGLLQEFGYVLEITLGASLPERGDHDVRSRVWAGGASEGARGAEGRRKGGWQKAERETGRGWSCTRILNENRDTASSHICSALTRKKLD